MPPGSLAPPTGDRFADAREIDGPEAERDADELFDFLLAALVDALARQLAATRSGSPRSPGR